MTLRYANGQTIEAVLLSRTDRTMRVAQRGSDDVVELNDVNGTWVSDDCEPVQVIFAYQRSAPAPASEEDFICPPELAAKLIHVLINPEETEEPSQTTVAAAPEVAAIAVQIV